MKNQGEKILSKRVLIGQKPWLEVVEIEYKDAYGKVHKYISVDRPGAVAIAAITNENELILIKQFRPPIGKYVLSLPAGLIDKDKSVSEIAKDELLEEAGFVANNWKLIGGNYNSTGILNEQVFLFLAVDLTRVGAKNNIDEGECIDVIKIPFTDDVISNVLNIAADNDCVVENSLIAHLAMVKEVLKKR